MPLQCFFTKPSAPRHNLPVLPCTNYERNYYNLRYPLGISLYFPRYLIASPCKWKVRTAPRNFRYRGKSSLSEKILMYMGGAELLRNPPFVGEVRSHRECEIRERAIHKYKMTSLHSYVVEITRTKVFRRQVRRGNRCARPISVALWLLVNYKSKPLLHTLLIGEWPANWRNSNSN